jgi:polyhydroxyalkanoate synthesis regulator phasin
VKQKDVFDLLKKSGAALADVSQGLMKNPAFVAAVATAYRGKQKVNDAVGQALKTMNVPTRTEFKRAVARIEALERELADRKSEQEAATPAPKQRPAARRKKAPPATGP